jgi:hypothetical protein
MHGNDDVYVAVEDLQKVERYAVLVDGAKPDRSTMHQVM